MTELFFEEVTENETVYFRRGRCDDFFVHKVGENSDCLLNNNNCKLTCGIKGNKNKELYRCLKHFTGKKFNKDDWKPINPVNIYTGVDMSLKDGESKERCFCSQTIQILRFVQYIPTEEIILIGSACIKKFLGDEKQKIADGCACIICDNVLDKRKKYQRDGYCTKKCKDKHLCRMCYECKELSILKSEPDWKRLCISCFKESKKYG
jgi:hypothetical protein